MAALSTVLVNSETVSINSETVSINSETVSKDNETNQASGLEGHFVYFGNVRLGQIVEARFGPVVWSGEDQWTFRIDFGPENRRTTWIRDFRREENNQSGKWRAVPT